jgi:hypothetical protein
MVNGMEKIVIFNLITIFSELKVIFLAYPFTCIYYYPYSQFISSFNSHLSISTLLSMEEINDSKHNQNKLELMERYLRQQRGSLDEMQRLGLEQGPEPTIVSLDTTQSVSSEECHSLSDYSSQARYVKFQIFIFLY